MRAKVCHDGMFCLWRSDVYVRLQCYIMYSASWLVGLCGFTCRVLSLLSKLRFIARFLDSAPTHGFSMSVFTTWLQFMFSIFGIPTLLAGHLRSYELRFHDLYHPLSRFVFMRSKINVGSDFLWSSHCTQTYYKGPSSSTTNLAPAGSKTKHMVR